jgi:hypothetical protein
MGRFGSSFSDPVPDTVARSFPPFFAFLASSGECRFSVGRSGSFAGVFPLPPEDPEFAGVLPEEAVVLSPELLSDLRFIVGLSGSSAGVLVLPFEDPELVVVLPEDAVVLSPEPLSDLRFIVGRSGSVDCVLALPFEDPEFAGVFPVDAGVLPEDAGGVLAVPPADPEAPESLPESLPALRFIVGRSESFVEVFAVPVPLLPVPLLPVPLLPDPLLPLPVPPLPFVVVLLWSVPADDVVSPAVFVVRCGRLLSFTELVRTGRVFDAFNAVTLLGAASGFTLP